jgi:hypothetical protein
MDKDVERNFLEMYAQAVVALPFDLKVLLEAVSDPDLEPDVRQDAAATVVHALNPKDGNVEPWLRHAEDVILLRLALRRIESAGGEGAPAFKDRFAEDFSRVEPELALLREAVGPEIVAWLDAKWPSLRKAVYAKKKISQFVDDDEVGAFLYEEGLKFGTNYPVTEKSIAGRLKQAQPIVDHLARKHEQDKKKITQ